MGEPFDLAESECRDLLSAGVVGRAAVCTPIGPHIIPVNYALVDDAIVLRTSPYSILGSHARGSIVAIEVDHFDYGRHRGWSVVARGRAEPVTRAAELDHIKSVWTADTWASGLRNLYLRVRLTELSGRRLGRGWHPLDELPVKRAM